MLPILLKGKARPGPSYLSFPGGSNGGANNCIGCGNHASINNLQAAAFTFEAWVCPVATSIPLIDKGKYCGTGYWNICDAYSNDFAIVIKCATTNASGQTAQNKVNSGVWQHILACYDNAGDRKGYLAVNGVWSNPSQVAGVGAVADDATIGLVIAARADLYNYNKYAGKIGWFRISNNIRYPVGVGFTPPARNAPPANDANTVRLFYVDEKSGTTLTDKSSNAQNATIYGGTWGRG